MSAELSNRYFDVTTTTNHKERDFSFANDRQVWLSSSAIDLKNAATANALYFDTVCVLTYLRLGKHVPSGLDPVHAQQVGAL